MEAHADFAELTAAGYVRTALPGEAATEFDGASDFAGIAMGAVVFPAISTGETIIGAFIYIHTGVDSTASVIGIYDVSPTIPTNGSTVTINAGDFARIA
jgi:hypothetical protein